MSFFQKYRAWLFLTILLILSLVLLSLSLLYPYRTGLIKKTALEAEAPLKIFFHDTTRYAANLWRRYLFLFGLEAENKRLFEANAALTRQLNEYREGYLEGIRLQKLADLKSTLPVKTVTARIIDRSRHSLFRTLLIDKGTVQGLREGLPVLTESGVAGRVLEASWHVSKILLIIDENSNVDAMIQRSRTPAILQGAGSQGAILKYIPKKETVNPGDVVVCSGMAGLFPKGRLLGTIRSVDGSSSSLFLSIVVVPAVDFLRLEEVVIPLSAIP